MPGIIRFAFAPVFAMAAVSLLYAATFGYGFIVLGLLIAPMLYAATVAYPSKSVGNRILQFVFGLPAIISVGYLILGILMLAEVNGLI